MRIVLVGATGIIGSAVAKALTRHQVVPVSRKHGEHRVDISDPASIKKLYEALGEFDALISTAGSAAYKPLSDLSDADFELGLRNKLMGQVNLVRFGLSRVRDGGSFTLTSGILARQPSAGSASISLVNAGLEGFVGAAALEMPRSIRINAVSPGWVSETLSAMARDPSAGTPAAVVARSYVASVEGKQSGQVIEASGGASK
jgi:NAD(P)-dependent dehydrogenase (short-subunit alcohol dehydrogenase family)